MPYSADIVKQARQRLAQMKADKESQSRQNLYEAYAQLPRLREIDRQLRLSMTVAAQTVFTQGGDAVAAMEQVKRENLILQTERAQLVAEHFAPGFLDETPVCANCGGSGYVGTAMCSCLQELCRQEQKKELRQLTTGYEQFENFRLDYYSDRVDPTYGASHRDIMALTLQRCRNYADAFAPGCGNLLFVGNTGLGKTFLSACIANAVTDKGFSVAYESAPRLFAKLEKNRFNPDEQSREDARKFAQSDLLIVDDLGTEMPGSFVTAALYDLVNQRLLEEKNMIISTNLNVEEIAKRYSPQIASRLQGSFKGMTFVGEDIRVLKSRGM